jgi:phosphatidylserine synthase
MSLFSGFTEKLSDWIGVPGLIAAFTITLLVWLYYDLTLGMPLNNTMTVGVGICSLLLVSFIKILAGLIRNPTTKDDTPDEN